MAEYIVKIAASLVQYLLDRGISFEMIASAKEVVYFPFNRGPQHHENILKFLSVVQAESTRSLAEVFAEYLIIIMLDKDWRDLSHFLALMERDISVIPVLLISSTFLQAFDNKEVAMDINIKLSQNWKLKPILISCRDHLEGTFSRYAK